MAWDEPDYGQGALNSPNVVISWWSNCLALQCLNRLLEFTAERQIYVVQVGKSKQQKGRFRDCLPDQVVELVYPENLPGEHSRIIQYVAFTLLSTEAGVWLVDHDVFFKSRLEYWLAGVDTFLDRGGYSLCLPRREPGCPANTSPMFWLSPRRWPADISCIDPIPFIEREEARRPDLFRSRMELMMPQKDTLIDARDELETRGKVAYYPSGAGDEQSLADFGSYAIREHLPEHSHLSGLYLFSYDIPTELYQRLDWFRLWMQETVRKFIKFYESCPEEWLMLEDPILIQRLNEYREYIHV